MFPPCKTCKSGHQAASSISVALRGSDSTFACHFGASAGLPRVEGLPAHTAFNVKMLLASMASVWPRLHGSLCMASRALIMMTWSEPERCSSSVQDCILRLEMKILLVSGSQ